jgi:[ribosomal protein S5]-alanine N-acetyltransferase
VRNDRERLLDSVEVLPTLIGKRVLLRQPVSVDVEARLEIPRDPEENQMYGGDGAPKVFTRAEVKEGLAQIADQNLAAGRRFVIAARTWPDGRTIADPDGRFIGHIRLTYISRNDDNARLALGIFDRRFWSHGYGTEAVRLILRYGFEQLGLHRVDLFVLEINYRAIRCYEKCGFVREAVLRETIQIDGVWRNDLLMSILELEYRSQPWAGDPRG